MMKKSFKQKNKITRKNKNLITPSSGITLISLVVTIIVILILAGTSLNLTIGDNGIIKKAIQAKQMSEEAAILEEMQLELLASENGNSSENSSTLAVNKIFEENLDALGANPTTKKVEEAIEDMNSKLDKIGVTTKIIGIYTEEQLRSIGNNDEYPIDDVIYLVMNDITLKGEWTPIGSATTAFTGVFNGRGYKIEEMSISNRTEDNTGLFAVNKGKICNVNICGTSSIISQGIMVGGIAGQNYGEIDNCLNSIRISSYGDNDGSRVGGIVGQNESSGIISNCNNEASVYGKGKLVGGICGYSFGNIKNARNSGNIESDFSILNASGDSLPHSQVGGIVGDSEGSKNSPAFVSDCINTGTVKGNGLTTAGIAGCNYKYSTIRNSYNEGTVSSSNRYIGGITGDNYANVENCYNKGIISYTATMESNAYLGGVCGFNYGNVSNCHNEGKVEAERGLFVGGVIGVLKTDNSNYLKGTAEKCYNSGIVIGKKYVGGIVGRISSNATLNSSYNVISVEGHGFVGGISGDLSSTGIISNCYNKGEISISGSSDTSERVGGIVGAGYSTITNCYNSGTVTLGTQSKYAGGVAGSTSGTAKITNCYYLKSVCDAGIGTGTTGADGISSVDGEGLKALFTQLGNEFAENSEGDGFPVLKWQK